MSLMIHILQSQSICLDSKHAHFMSLMIHILQSQSICLDSQHAHFMSLMIHMLQSHSIVFECNYTESMSLRLDVWQCPAIASKNACVKIRIRPNWPVFNFINVCNMNGLRPVTMFAKFIVHEFVIFQFN